MGQGVSKPIVGTAVVATAGLLTYLALRKHADQKSSEQTNGCHERPAPDPVASVAPAQESEKVAEEAVEAIDFTAEADELAKVLAKAKAEVLHLTGEFVKQKMQKLVKRLEETEQKVRGDRSWRDNRYEPMGKVMALIADVNLASDAKVTELCDALDYTNQSFWDDAADFAFQEEGCGG